MPKHIRRAAGIALAALIVVLVAPSGAKVKTEAGILQGSAEAGVESFKGIPFAAPPLGVLRWRAPQPVEPWSGVRPATLYGHDCEQTSFPHDLAPLQTTPSEDCLYLNVWRPAGSKAGRKLPVMVWIHGGAFVNGGSSSAVFAGDRFARKGVIMVSANYRLGRFGFFGFPALNDEGDGLVGNYGFMDQIAALKWVQRNIAAFGGDPDNVTLFGESVGGASVHVLLTAPMSKGLFVRAIVQSGGGREDPAGVRTVKVDKPGLPSLETLGLAFAQRYGITGSDATALAALRALPAAAVNGGLSMMTYFLPDQAKSFGGPAMDGRLVVASPEQVYRMGGQARTPIIVGATNADFGVQNTSSKEGLFAQFGQSADKARAFYDPDGKASTDAVIEAASADWTMLEPARFVAEQFARQGLPAYAYRFSYVGSSMTQTWKAGAPHASDVPYAMNTLPATYGDNLNLKDAKVADMMNSYWVNFAKKGDPNGPGLPRWPIYSPAQDQIMIFAADGRARAVKDPWKERLDLMASFH